MQWFREWKSERKEMKQLEEKAKRRLEDYLKYRQGWTPFLGTETEEEFADIHRRIDAGDWPTLYPPKEEKA